MSKPSLVIVVVEDSHHRMLAYRYLSECGLREHQIRIERSPSGKGSAENWVRGRYAKEVNVYRRRQAQTALIVVIDSDAGTVQDRLRQLDQALGENGVDATEARERIAKLAPKRNVETWILCLNGHAVNEEADYKYTRSDWSDLIPGAAKTLCAWTRRGADPPVHCINSLQHGIEELRRLGL